MNHEDTTPDRDGRQEHPPTDDRRPEDGDEKAGLPDGSGNTSPKSTTLPRDYYVSSPGGMMEFIKFPKIPRLKRGVVVTEKIDGTNAQVCIGPDGEFAVGSRKRWITSEDDNYGFARWASENKEELLKLGEGRHFGEWWGSGVQRGYGLDKGEKRFSLFNIGRWRDNLPTDVVSLVPVLWEGPMEDLDVPHLLDYLKVCGSQASPEFMNPEGIVVYHVAAKQCFKVTYDDTAKNIQ